MASPTSRTINYLRGKGYRAGVVERWIPQARKRIDLFGFIDIVAMREDRGGIIGIQATSFSNLSARVAKIVNETPEEARLWIACGGKVEIWTWVQLKRERVDKAGRTKKLLTWVGRVTDVDLDVINTGFYDWSEVYE